MIYEPTKDEMRKIRAFMRKYGNLSHTWLQRQFGLSMQASKEVKKQLEEK